MHRDAYPVTEKIMEDSMKKILALVLAMLMVAGVFTGCAAKTEKAAEATEKAADASDVVMAVLVPNADHGWTGAVMKYAEEYAQKLTGDGKAKVNVITSTDAANQIQQVEDLIENKTATHVVILPQDNTLEATLKKLADSGIPFAMFDRVIDSVADAAVASVKGDNNGIGAETAKRFIAKGMKPGDKILIMPGDNSSVPEMRNNGFFSTLLDNGWTQDQIDAIESTDYTGWSRSKGKELFTAWLDSNTVDEIKDTKWIFTHDDEIAMGILEALKSGDLDAEKKDAFLSAGVNLGTSSGLNEMYSVLKGIHQKDYTAEVAQLADLFSVTYDPAMIKAAMDDMITFIGGGKPEKDHVIAVSVVDKDNVADFQGFGDAVSK